MFDKIFDVVSNFWDIIKPCQILNPYERGVRLYKGRFQSVVGPGVRWKWPLVGEILTDNVVPTTTPLHEQTLTTADDLTCVVRGLVTWRINNIHRALLEVEDLDGVLADVVNGVIASEVTKRTWKQIHAPSFGAAITTRARIKAFKYGLDIIEVNFMDLVKLRAYRLIGER